MNILIATQDAPLYLARFLEKFINIWNKNESGSIYILVASPYVNNSFLKELTKRYKLYGLNSFFKISFIILLNKFLSYLYLLKVVTSCYSIKNVIAKYSLKKVDSNSINEEIIIEFIKKQNIELVISIAYPEILIDQILEAPKYGCLNYHTALLPKYRGRQPLFWALFNDERETGITIHKMDKHIDRGEVVLQKSIDIDKLDTLNDLYTKTIAIGPELLYKGILELKKDNQNFINLKNTNERLYKFPDIKDGLMFRKKGKKFI